MSTLGSLLPSANNNMTSTRQVTLLHLKTNGPSTARNISESLGISPMAVRMHLQRLAGEGWVAVHQQRQGVGRPAYVYSLTDAAEGLFPTSYEDLINLLVDSLRQFGGESAVKDTIMQYFERSIEQIRALTQTEPPAERLRMLAQELNQNGYMVKLTEKNGTIRMQQHHCSIARLVEHFPETCDIEAEVYQSLMGEQPLIRTKCLRDGDEVCEYVLESK